MPHLTLEILNDKEVLTVQIPSSATSMKDSTRSLKDSKPAQTSTSYSFRLVDNFKGFMVGNAYTSFASGTIAGANVQWGLQLLPAPLWYSQLFEQIFSVLLLTLSTSFFC